MRRISLLFVNFLILLTAINAQEYSTSKIVPEHWKDINKSVEIKGLTYSLYMDTIANERCAIMSHSSVSKVKIPQKIKYEKNTYIVRGVGHFSKNTTHVYVPSTVHFISKGACYIARNLTEFIFEEGSSLKVIGDEAFEENKLTAFDIPNSVEVIGRNAFKGSGIKTITLPSAIKNIKERAFADCTNLTNIYFNSALNNTVSIGNEAFRNSGITIAVFPSIYSIGECAFDGCTNLKRLTFGYGYDGVLYIGREAFRNCHNLTTFTYDIEYLNEKKEVVSYFKKVKLQNSSFENCYSIKDVSFEVDTIPRFAFANCKSLTNITLFGEAICIKESAFDNCISLKETLINNTTYIGGHAFNGCTALKELSFNTELKKTVEAFAFSECTNLQKVIGLTAHDDYKASLDMIFYKTKVDYTPIEMSYKYYVKSNLERYIENWQKKKEYETTVEYKERVTEGNRNLIIENQKDTLRNKYIQKYKPQNLKAEILEYDADGGVYKIRVNNLNTYQNLNYETIKTELEKLTPPVYTYAKVPRNVAPDFKASWDKVKIEPTYCISKDYLGIASCKFKLNGKTYNSPVLYDDETANVELNLSPLDIWDDNKNNLAQEKYDDTLDKNIPKTNAINDKTFVVIIGNEFYKEVSKVSYAQNDAKIFAEYCQKTLGVSSKNIRNYQNATYAMMLSAIKDMKSISEAYNGDVNFIFYYCGHGVPNEKTHDAYLLPIDANPSDIETCYPISRLYTELGKMSANRITVFMDACFSGAQRGEGMLVEARGVAIKAKTSVPQGNMVVFSAASGDETAYPYKEKGHGMFTYFLLKKLNETKGNVTLGELGDYITTQVKQQSIVVNRKSQTPTVVPSSAMSGDWRGWKLK